MLLVDKKYWYNNNGGGEDVVLFSLHMKMPPGTKMTAMTAMSVVHEYLGYRTKSFYCDSCSQPHIDLCY
jgi:hypothetical protein